MLLAAALVLALAALVAAGHAMHREHRSRHELESARARLARMDAELPKREQETAVAANALRRDVRVSFEVNEARYDRAVVAHLLQDFRDVAGGEEAIYWRWIPERDSLAPSVWSSDGTRPAYFSITEWAPLVQWSAEGGIIQTVGQDELVHVGAAPVMQGETLLGVLSITHRSGLGLDRTALREWLPRLALQLATVQELVDVRRRYGRHMRQSQAMLDAVQRLQGDKTGEGLARALCETALDVSGARAAALIRWDAEADSGEVYFATEATGLRAPASLDGASVVAEACRSGKLHVLEDACGLTDGQSLFGIPRAIQGSGSVAVVPLTKDGRTLGALVLEAEEIGALTQDEARPLTVLGAVVVGSLELMWQFAEVDKRA
ncbi:MAG: GAF domain-containing protein, partial [Gemmatimonadaceae bacterium]